MLLTEADAKTKWCPMVRMEDQYAGAAANTIGPDFNCIASGCMMWRQGPVEFEYQPVNRDVLVDVRDEAPKGWAVGLRINQSTGTQERVWKREKPRRGYCGLAGRVEP